MTPSERIALAGRISRRDPIHSAVDDERRRQDEKWGWPNAGLASDNVYKKVAILAEEMGEVANAVLEGDHENLKVELVQVAAVCFAWLESIEERGV